MQDKEQEILPTGKLPAGMLAELLKIASRGDPAVVEGPGVGRDVALIDVGAEELLAAKADPITFATDEIGYYAVVVNSNDLATRGALPRWMLATILLPEGRTTKQLALEVAHQLRHACDAFDITLIGGHTEITYGLDRPIVAAAMLGTVPRGVNLAPENVRPGDAVLMTKAVAVEGTSIIARELGDELIRRGFGPSFVERCAAMLHAPGISVLREAQAAVATGGVRTMHDPTEGGIATALWELAEACKKTLLIDVAQIAVLPECRRLCDAFGLDPLGLIASGSLLIVAAAEATEGIINAVQAADVECVQIGRIAGPEEERGPCVVDVDSGRVLPRFDQDELTRIL